jgi:inosose dehydratase
MRVGNAPVSWGIYEAAMGVAPAFPPEDVLQAIARAGYEGTELGPYGYLPTEPQALSTLLRTTGLALGSSFVPVRLADPAGLPGAIDEVLKVGRLLSSQGVGEVIVADAMDDGRARIAGRVPADGSAGWSDADWRIAARCLDTVAERLDQTLGMKVVVHHHAGTFVETQGEIDRLLEMTDPARVGLLLDTGHLVYGGGDALGCLRKHGRRVRYVHLKDVLAERLAEVRGSAIDLKTAWSRGVFCQLGAGAIDFVGLVSELGRIEYSGWLIVEQDVIPAADGSLSPDPFVSARESRRYVKERLGV